MRFQKNFLMPVSGVMMLIVLSLLIAPPTTKATSSISQAAVPYTSATSDDLSIDASLGDENISLERRKHRRRGTCCSGIVIISIIAVLVGKPAGDGGPPMIDLRATITGPDAVRGSLLYGLAWLAGDADPVVSVRRLGYDLDVIKEHDRPCDDPTGKLCQEHARRLATLLDATLALGNPDERALFRQGAAKLGLAGDCSASVSRESAAVDAGPSDIFIDASLGDKEIVLEKAGRGSHDEYLVVILKDVNVSRGQGEPPQRVDLRTVIEGVDAQWGSLRYAVAWLAGFTDPLGAVRALGYDITVSNAHVHSCRDQQRGHTCENAAQNLATLIDATLALSNSAERARFGKDAAALGVAPDCVPREP